MFSDLDLAKGYLNKAQSSKDRGLEFSLPFSFYKKCLNRKKKCDYTGLIFDRNVPGLSPTLERVNPAVGYTVNNTVVVCQVINQLKGIIDDPKTPITVLHVIKMMNVINKR
jgi:hypothetical protein